MKKAIVLGAAMLLAGAAAFAADEKKGPTFKFSGRARAGYVFTFSDANEEDVLVTPKYGTYSDKTSKRELKLQLHFGDADGLWDINVKSGNADWDSDDKLKAKLTLDLGKMLGQSGVDLGDFSLKAAIGNSTSESLLRAYNNATGDDKDKFQIKTSYSTTFTAGYKNLTAQIVTDPVTTKGDNAGFAVSAMYADKDVGYKVSAGYVRFDAGWSSDADDDANNEIGAISNYKADNGVMISGTLDIAKMIKNDNFKLAASGAFDYAFDDDAKIMSVAGNVSGGIDAVDGVVEYVYTAYDPDEYYGAAEPPVRGGASHLSGQTEPPKNHFPSEMDLIP